MALRKRHTWERKAEVIGPRDGIMKYNGAHLP